MTPHYVVLHCSDTAWGTARSIKKFHVEVRGFQDIGYHWLVNNSYPTFESWHEGRPLPDIDGSVEAGRPETRAGAHALGYNDKSIGVALIGTGGVFSSAQLRSVLMLVREICQRFEVPFKNVLGHYETGANKTCPDLDMDYFRGLLL